MSSPTPDPTYSFNDLALNLWMYLEEGRAPLFWKEGVYEVCQFPNKILVIQNNQAKAIYRSALPKISQS